jgi:DNA processing protein
MDKEDLAYLLALYSVDYIGPKRLELLLDHFGDPKKAWQASYEELAGIKFPKKALEALLTQRIQLDPKAYLDSIVSQGIKILTLKDKKYPKLLKEIANPPPILFIKGSFKKQDEKALAVVGTRTPSFYGRQVTELLVERLVTFGVTIVSGMARGIDSLAHKTALKNHGRTIAVLGSGVDVCYPPENKNLLEEIREKGVVVSQFPYSTPPHPGLFPARNRLISGLSLGILVTEAAQKSGTKITAEFARKQGKPVFSVPGPITSKVSQGTNELIKMGAKLVYNTQDILEELGKEVGGRNLEVRKREVKPESKEEEILLSLLGPTPIHIDDLVRKSNLSISSVGSTLSLMEIKGKVKNVGNKMYILVTV